MKNQKHAKYRIKDWKSHFENRGSRQVNILSYCMLPNKIDGEGVIDLLSTRSEDDPNYGAALYGCWVLLILSLSKQHRDVRDGWITSDGTSEGEPITMKRLAVRFRVPESLIVDMLEATVKNGWVVEY